MQRLGPILRMLILPVILFLVGCGDGEQQDPDTPGPTESAADLPAADRQPALVASSFVPPVWEGWVWALIDGLDGPNERHVALARLSLLRAEGVRPILSGDDSTAAQQDRLRACFRADPARFLLLRPESYIAGQGDVSSWLATAQMNGAGGSRVAELIGTWKGSDPGSRLNLGLELREDMTFRLGGVGQPARGSWCIWHGRVWTFIDQLGKSVHMAFLMMWTPDGSALRTGGPGGDVILKRREG